MRKLQRGHRKRSTLGEVDFFYILALSLVNILGDVFLFTLQTYPGLKEEQVH